MLWIIYLLIFLHDFDSFYALNVHYIYTGLILYIKQKNNIFTCGCYKSEKIVSEICIINFFEQTENKQNKNKCENTS